MRKSFSIQDLDRICIMGVGLLGGSIALACRAAGFTGRLMGVGRRPSSLRKAIACEAADETTCDPVAGVTGADLVVLCTPIGSFESLLDQIGPHLKPDAIITDVASTKGEVVALAERILPPNTLYVGSHPMAGSEKTGVEYARADLFERALCMVTPTDKTPPALVRWMRAFWEALGARTLVLDADRHDQCLAQVSHLPHAVAAALVHQALRNSAIELAGPGFADTTRIASGEPRMWTDIFRTNRQHMLAALDGLIEELGKFRQYLADGDLNAVRDWLTLAQQQRDQWTTQRFRKKVLPP